MCILIVKETGASMPSKRTMEICFHNNGDGAGYALWRKGSSLIRIRKGFMEFDDFYNSISNERVHKNDAMLIHFRIATSGGVNQENTHPFPISSCVKKLGRDKIECEVAMAHNGVIGIKEEKGLSDTATFIKYIVSDRYALNGLLKDNWAIRYMFEEAIGASKVAILKNDGTIYRYNANLWEDKCKKTGLYFSNDGYKMKRVKSSVKYTSYGNRHSDYDRYNRSYPRYIWEDSHQIYGGTSERVFYSADLDSGDIHYRINMKAKEAQVIKFGHICTCCGAWLKLYSKNEYSERYNCGDCYASYAIFDDVVCKCVNEFSTFKSQGDLHLDDKTIAELWDGVCKLNSRGISADVISRRLAVPLTPTRFKEPEDAIEGECKDLVIVNNLPE